MLSQSLRDTARSASLSIPHRNFRHFGWPPLTTSSSWWVTSNTVHPDDPVQFGVAGNHALSLCHRSWLSVFGQNPRLCIFARDADLDAGPIDSEAPWGRSLLRNLWRADTVEFSMAKTEGP